jgi:hypothetical protein
VLDRHRMGVGEKNGFWGWNIDPADRNNGAGLSISYWGSCNTSAIPEWKPKKRKTKSRIITIHVFIRPIRQQPRLGWTSNKIIRHAHIHTHIRKKPICWSGPIKTNRRCK